MLRLMALTVEPLGLLAIDRDAIPAQQDVQPPIAEPSALLRQFVQPRPQAAIIRPTERYRMLVRSAPTTVHARRSLIPSVVWRCPTACCSAAVVTTFFLTAGYLTAGLSTAHC